MAATIKLEIVTPEAKIFSDNVDMVTLTGTVGEKPLPISLIAA